MSILRSSRGWLAGVVVGGLAGAALVAPRPVRAADEPAKESAKESPAPKAAGRTREQIGEDLNKVGQELSQILPDPQALFDEARRKEMAPKVVPLMKKLVQYYDEFAGIDPIARAQLGRIKSQIQTFLVVAGDADTETQLKQQAGGADAKAALAAKGTLALGQFQKSTSDADARNKILDDLQALAKANPEDEVLAEQIMRMATHDGVPEPIKDRAVAILGSFKGVFAKDMLDELNADKNLKALEGKPLTLAGPTVDGKPFTSADWKGKVVLVDFWATWCGPCRAALPRVKKAYATYHGRGLEILGVSCDRGAEDLKDFLKENPDMPWPQLFDPQQKDWHPLAKQYGIRGIPTMFLIDKKGVVRSITAREQFEELIPKMLDEK